MEDAKIILTIEELDQLKKIQNNLNQIVISLGQIEIQFEDLKETKSQIIKQLVITKQEQDKLGELLNKKYGNGSVNMETGEFTINPS